MTYEIFWYPNPKRDSWVAQVNRNGIPIVWVFRKSEAEAKAWAEKNIQVYAKGKTPTYG